eukprot:TRINITY_DN5647_c0_g1_i1.p1 TRINITY_DN5647_c0_g1~~TRINITY_DN5647_c0_g1_i1.p1  ORF type:complete len:214 (+),score=61.75 TRINITY_DN5647_c0_g1_i1:142-783(+)
MSGCVEPSSHSLCIREVFSALDGCRDLWKENNEKSLIVGEKLINDLVKTQYLSITESWGRFKDDSDLQNRVRIKLDRQIQSSHDEMLESCKVFSSIIEDMKKNHKILLDLEENLRISMGKKYEESSLLKTLPIPDFVNFSGEILEMYEEELENKRDILDRILTYQFSPLNPPQGRSEEMRETLLMFMLSWQLEGLISIERINYISEAVEVELS